MDASYLLILHSSEGYDKIKKCICGHQIKQGDLLEKIDYNPKTSFLKFNNFKCDNCHTKLNVAVV